MNIGVHSLRLTSPKWKSKSDLEWLQVGFLDLDSFNDDYGSCLDDWNELKWSGTPTGIAAAVASNLKSDFVILRFLKCVGCLDSCYMLFMRCWNNLFGLHCFLSPNSIVTCNRSKTWRFERNVEKAWTKDALVWFELVLEPLFIGQGFSAMWELENLKFKPCKWIKG